MGGEPGAHSGGPGEGDELVILDGNTLAGKKRPRSAKKDEISMDGDGEYGGPPYSGDPKQPVSKKRREGEKVDSPDVETGEGEATGDHDDSDTDDLLSGATDKGPRGKLEVVEEETLTRIIRLLKKASRTQEEETEVQAVRKTFAKCDHALAILRISRTGALTKNPENHVVLLWFDFNGTLHVIDPKSRPGKLGPSRFQSPLRTLSDAWREGNTAKRTARVLVDDTVPEHPIRDDEEALPAVSQLLSAAFRVITELGKDATVSRVLDEYKTPSFPLPPTDAAE